MSKTLLWLMLCAAHWTAHSSPLETLAERTSNLLDEFATDLAQKGVTVRTTIAPETVVGFAAVRETSYGFLLLVSTKMAHFSDSSDAIDAILCHEMGHILGGAPFQETHVDDSGEITSEGQADYFATSKCLRRLYEKVPAETEKIVKGIPLSIQAEFQRRGCLTATCQRAAHAAYLALTSSSSVKERTHFSLFSRDSTISSESITWGAYPSPQCRLDTLIAGAVCVKSAHESFSADNQRQGACTRDTRQVQEFLGVRPRCWFNPASLDKPY